jgi:hypothetical protein
MAWIALVVAGVLLAILALSVWLSWVIGAIASRVQDHRSEPDFRQRKRTGKGRSE